MASEYLLCEVGPREHAGGVTGEHLVHHFGHAQVRALLEALRQADDGHPRAQVGREILEGAAEAVRGHTHHEHVRLLDDLGERARRTERMVQDEAR